MEAKALAENGKVIKENAPKEEADAIIAKFKEAGATAVAE
jgi:ribosomal protein L7/L12